MSQNHKQTAAGREQRSTPLQQAAVSRPHSQPAGGLQTGSLGQQKRQTAVTTKSRSDSSPKRSFDELITTLIDQIEKQPDKQQIIESIRNHLDLESEAALRKEQQRQKLSSGFVEAGPNDRKIRERLDDPALTVESSRQRSQRKLAAALTSIDEQDYKVRETLNEPVAIEQTTRMRGVRALQAAMSNAVPQDYKVRDRLEAPRPDVFSPRSAAEKVLQQSLRDMTREDMAVRDKLNDTAAQRESDSKTALVQTMLVAMRDVEPDDFVLREWLGELKREFSEPTLKENIFQLPQKTRSESTVETDVQQTPDKSDGKFLDEATAAKPSPSEEDDTAPDDLPLDDGVAASDSRVETSKAVPQQTKVDSPLSAGVAIDLDAVSEQGAKGVGDEVLEEFMAEAEDKLSDLRALLNAPAENHKPTETAVEDTGKQNQVEMAATRAGLDAPSVSSAPSADVQTDSADGKAGATADVAHDKSVQQSLAAFINDTKQDMAAVADKVAAVEKIAAEKAAAEAAAAQHIAAEEAARQQAAQQAAKSKNTGSAERASSKVENQQDEKRGRVERAELDEMSPSVSVQTRSVSDLTAFEQRFEALSQQLEKSLADLNPKAEIRALDRKLDELSSRLETVMKDQPDAAAFAAIEVQLETVVATLEQTSDHAERLTWIEEQIAQLSETVRQLEQKVADIAKTGSQTGFQAGPKAAPAKGFPAAEMSQGRLSGMSGHQDGQGLLSNSNFMNSLTSASGDVSETASPLEDLPPTANEHSIFSGMGRRAYAESLAKAQQAQDDGSAAVSEKETVEQETLTASNETVPFSEEREGDRQTAPEQLQASDSPAADEQAEPLPEVSQFVAPDPYPNPTPASYPAYEGGEPFGAVDEAGLVPEVSAIEARDDEPAGNEAQLQQDQADGSQPDDQADVFATPAHSNAPEAPFGHDSSEMAAPVQAFDAAQKEDEGQKTDVATDSDIENAVRLAANTAVEQAQPDYNLAVLVSDDPATGREAVLVSEDHGAVTAVQDHQASTEMQPSATEQPSGAEQQNEQLPEVLKQKPTSKGRQTGGISAELRERLVMRASAPSQGAAYTTMPVGGQATASSQARPDNLQPQPEPEYETEGDDQSSHQGQPQYASREEFLAAARRASLAVATEAIESATNGKRTSARANRDELAGALKARSADQKIKSNSLLYIATGFLVIAMGVLAVGKWTAGTGSETAPAEKVAPAKPGKFGELSDSQPGGKADRLPQIQKFGVNDQRTAKATSGAASNGVIIIPAPSASQASKADAARMQAARDQQRSARPAIITGASKVAVKPEGDSLPAGNQGSFVSGIQIANVPMPPATIGPVSLRIAASKGDPKAQFEVANRFLAGQGVKRDYVEAANWYKRAAAQGYAPAQYRLGTLYERGRGVIKDLARAKIWYQRAAQAGNIRAMHNYAVLHTRRGLGEPDYSTAATWFEKAARRGLTDSQFNLAIMYHNGLGVRRDNVQAYKWFALAARGGDKEAQNNLKLLEKKLTAGELVRARKALAAFKPAEIVKSANYLGPEKIAAMRKTANSASAQQYYRRAPKPAVKANPVVKRAQELLKKAGFDPGPADGQIGPKTSAAIKAFQRRLGLDETGKISDELIVRLEALT